MIGYNNPQVITENFVGLDAAIQAIQKKLSCLPWLEKSFGRGIIQREEITRTDAQNRLQDNQGRFLQSALFNLVPLGAGPQQEPFSLMPNDNLKSYCFWLARDPTAVLDYDPQDMQNILSTPVSLIFWYNLKRVDPSKDFRYSEQLKIDVLRVLKGVYNLEITSIFETFDRVFDGMTINETYRQYMKAPCAALRIDGKLSYSAFCENC